MGNSTSVDTSPIQLENLYSLCSTVSQQNATLNASRKYKSNLKLWCVSANEPGGEPTFSALSFEDFHAFNSRNCYIVLHLHRKDVDGKQENGIELSSPKQQRESLLKLVESAERQLTPRGLEHSFSVNEPCTFSFSKSGDTRSEDISYNLYLWHGRDSDSIVQASAITKTFEIERVLLEPKLPENLFDAGDPVTLSQLYVDDIPQVKSNKKPQMSSAATFLSLYQHCHLFRHLTNSNMEQDESEDLAGEDLSIRSLLKLPDIETSMANWEDDTELQASPVASPASQDDDEEMLPPAIPFSPNGKKPRPPAAIPKKPFVPRLPQHKPLSAVERKTSGVEEPKKPTPLTPRKDPGSSTPRTLSSNRTASTSSGRNSVSRLPLGSVDRSYELVDPSPTPREEKPRDYMNPRMSGAELVVYYRKICSQILDYVYIGSDVVARNKDQLMKNKITHIINAALLVCDIYFPTDFKYLAMNLYDSGEEAIVGVFFTVIDFIEKAKAESGRVLVHCHEGVSRSSTCTIAYIMWKQRMKFQIVNEEVKRRRAVCSPNPGFIVQLLQWEKLIFAPQVHLFRIAPLNDRFTNHRQVASKLCNSNHLDSRTCFILWNSKTQNIYLWIGSKSSKTLLVEGQNFARLLKQYSSPDATIHEINEGGAVPSHFSESLEQVDINPKLPLDTYKDLTYLDNPENISSVVVPKPAGAMEEDEDDLGVEDASLYSYDFKSNSWNEYENFDSEDLFDDQIYVLKPKNGEFIFVWMGNEVEPPGGMEIDDYALVLGRQFLASIGASIEKKIIVVDQDSEPDTFWKYFADG